MKKIAYTIVAVALAGCLIVGAVGAPGGSDDPLVTLKYLKEIFTDKMAVIMTQKAEGLLTDSKKNVDNKLAEVDKVLTADGLVKAAVTDAVMEKVRQGNLAGATTVTLKAGEKITCNLGTQVVVLSGSARLFGTAGDVVNLTAGRNANVNTSAPNNTKYFFAADKTSGFEAEEGNTVLLVSGGFVNPNAYNSKNTKYADALAELGLFRGTGAGYELENKGSRLEGIIMLIRLMGEETVALNHSGKTSFTDLGTWMDAHKYIGFAFDKGYTKGTTEKSFEPKTLMTGNIYATFVLRALGYSDLIGDFSWQTADQKLVELGLITQAEANEIKENGLYRDHIVKISYNALGAKIKSSSQTLGQKLIADGVFTQAQFDKATQTATK